MRQRPRCRWHSHCRCPPAQAPATRGKRGCRSKSRRAGCGCGLNARRCGTAACLLTPIAPHSNPAAKAPHLPLSPEKASVDLVVRWYRSAIGHSIGRRRNNTNETPGCRLLRDEREHERNIRALVGQGDAANTNETSGGSSVTATAANTRRRIVNAKFRRWVLRSSAEVFEWLRTHKTRGDACRRRRAKPLFTGKATRVAQDFPPRVRHVDRDTSAAANHDRLSARSPSCRAGRTHRR